MFFAYDVCEMEVNRMNNNINNFGDFLLNTRVSIGLTLNDCAKLARIHPETIRRIESNKVLPNFETLELLSLVLKKDLSSIFLDYRLNDPDYCFELINRLERNFDSDNYFALDSDLKELNSILNKMENNLYKQFISQLILLTQAVILYKCNNDNNNALIKLIEALKITTPDFEVANYNSHIYSHMEIRILMNIGFIYNRLNDEDKYLEILKFCVNSVEVNDKLYPKLCHNLSTAYYRNKEYLKALKYANKGIESSKMIYNFASLGYLYYGKGLAEYRLNDDSFLDTLNLSITLCNAFGQDNLAEIIKNNCKKFFNIDLLKQL